LKQPVVLRVYKGDRLETVKQFDHSQIVMGRTSDAQLVLEDDDVAPLHAMIEERAGEYFVSDLGSHTGTFRNDNRILETKLASGDEIKIGPFRIQFFVGAPKPAVKPVVEPVAAPTPQPPDETGVITLPISEPPPTPDSVSAPSAPPVHAFAPAKSKLGSKKKHGKTFAPPSPYANLSEIIRPHKGSVVEVLVAWRDRIISSNHFARRGSVYISSAESADVIVPIINSRSKYELLKLGTGIVVCLTQEMTGELIRENETLTFAELTRQNRIRNVGSHFELEIRQGEMVRVGLQNDLISVYIRYVSETPKPLVAPLLDMTSSETTGVVLALAIAAILGLYMNIYTPSPLLEDEARQEEPIRKAIVQFTPPPKRQKVELSDDTEEKKKVVEVKEQKKDVRQTPTPAKESPGNAGKAAALAPKQAPPAKDAGSLKHGGAVKTSPKEGAQMKAEKPDPSKMGLLSAFGRGGVRKQLDKAYGGSGELAGMADSATGAAGNAENRPGDDLGSKFKETGSGKGSATVGIAGVGTQGRGTGGTGYGTGGIGTKGSVQINVGGQEADFAGGMDKEAIRRVIREHIREIRSCYERELQKSPELYGKLILEWDIEEEGRVSRVSVKSNALGNATVASCIMTRLKTWKFPDPPKDQIGRVVYPFVFSSQ
jgi:hypothetical protein